MIDLGMTLACAVRSPGIFVSVIFLFTSCIERFGLEIPRTSANYIVDAILIDDPDYQYVKLFRTNKGTVEVVSSAYVYLENKNGLVATFVEVQQGKYETPEYLPIQTGDTYRLAIEISETEKLISEWETVPEKVGMTKGFWRQRQRSVYNENGILLLRNGFDFLISTEPMPQNEVFLRYDYETTHINEAPFVPPLCPGECRNCYIRTLAANYINQTHLIGQKDRPMKEHLVEFVELDVRFSFRFTMLVKQISHTKNAGTFYELAEQQRNLRGTLFDPPPAVLRGNLKALSNPEVMVYGLFEVGRVSEIPITVFNGDFENKILTYLDVCIQKTNSGARAPECENCNNEPGAGPRPHYF